MTVKLIFVLVFSFFGFTSAKTICGTEPCRDLETAKDCESFQHCLDNVWVNQHIEVEKNNICKTCLEMVKEARDQLNSNETISELKQVFEGSCKLMVVRPVVQYCMKLADEFVPELVAILSSQMDPEVVCTVSKLCYNIKEKPDPQVLQQCITCKNFVRSAVHFIDMISKEDFQARLSDMCRQMGSYSDACLYYVSQNSDLYFNQTKEALLNYPCEVMGICPSFTTVLQELVYDSSKPKTLEEVRDLMCTSCPSFVGQFKNFYQKMQSILEVKNQINGNCRHLGLSKEACKTLIDSHYKKFNDFVSYDYNENLFCSFSFVFCKSVPESVPSWFLSPANSHLVETDTKFRVNIPTNELNVVIASNSKDSKKQNKIQLSFGDPITEKLKISNRIKISFGDTIDASPMAIPVVQYVGGFGNNKENCKACTQMFDCLTTNMAKDNEYIKNLLSFVCKDMPNPELCQGTLDNSAEKLAQILDQHIASEKVCPELVPSCEVKWRLGSLKTQASPSEGSCKFCRNIFNSLRASWSNSQKNHVMEVLINICNAIPEESRQMCIPLVHNFVNKTLPYIFENFNEKETCGYLKLCGNPTSVSSESIETPETEKNDLQKKSCKTCLLIVETVLDEVKDPDNEDEIRKVLDKICKKLPSGIEKSCETIVNAYSDDIVKLITENLDPNQVCAKLHLCKHKSEDTSNESQDVIKSFQKSLKPKKISCSFCMTAIDMLLKEIENNKTEESIRNVLDNLCNYMPEEVRDTCKNWINEYTDDIIDMIVADFNADEVCTYLKLCPSKTLGEISKTFSIATNEVESNVCGSCQLLESTLEVDLNNHDAAESLLALLVDYCLTTDPEKLHHCNQFEVEKILLLGVEGVVKTNNLCFKTGICRDNLPKRKEYTMLEQIHSSVQECAMCEAVVGIVSDHNELLSKKYNFAKSSSIWCSSVPINRKRQCENTLTSYGPSIVNLLVDKHTPLDDVCVELKLCYPSQQTKVRMPVTDVEQGGIHAREDSDCLRGPSYWCKSVENAKKCGTLPHCQEIIWNGKTPSY